ncbi:ribosomal protein S18-alanine N-acetyltransferase [Gallaecimonas mangrovi]|uniref:ribosomal protein S18-alanine N-acetyltransferase n=1 Tax=Gallaecimonas mangrovi TaxID=2291597 RepID=UPI000E209058|nr:ribosomal protein S18-alanine N-acetyltransferase [Gallaecimonas mangrovi]
MTLSTATVDDLAKLALIEATQQYPWTDKQLASCFGGGYRVRLFCQQQQPLAFSICQRVLDETTLFNICVLPDCRGQGLGQQLMADLIAEAKAAGDNAIFLEVRASNSAAIRLYLRHGFKEVGRRKGYYPCVQGREDALVMCLALTAP